MSPSVRAAFTVLLPVKPPARGKSRLAALSDPVRGELAAGFALDTAAAALHAASVGAVLAVTDDHRFAGELRGLGCAVIPDGVSGDLNASLAQAASEAGRRWPTLQPVALCADLPALRAEDLDEALAEASGHPGACFVADAAGTGTTLYTAPLAGFAPRFGPGSCRSHRDAGAVRLTGDLLSLRRDVDDLADLESATLLGVGRHTRAVLASQSP